MNSHSWHPASICAQGGLLMLFCTAIAVGDQAPPPSSPSAQSAEINIPYTISKQTTWITEYVRANGAVDYVAALNARLSKGVTPENNAAIPLMKAFGANIIEEANREDYYKSLGVAAPEDGDGSFKSFPLFVENHLASKGVGNDSDQARKSFTDQMEKALEKPWSCKDYPLMADWLDDNAEAAKLAHEASRRSKLYIPVVIEENEPLLNLLLPVAQNLRELGRLLTARAMLAIEEGRIDDAQQDLLSCHRLASLLGQQSTIIEVSVGYSIDSIAYRGDLALAQSEKAAKQLRNYLQELTKLPPLSNMVETIDSGERLFALDAICKLAILELNHETVGDFGLPDPPIWHWLFIDWDFVLKRFNHKLDHLVAALQFPKYKLRTKILAHTETQTSPPEFRLIWLMLESPRRVISERLANKIQIALIPYVSYATEMETRAKTLRDFGMIALALAEYHGDHGSYPENLSDVSPTYLKTRPQDRFTGQPLKYKRQDIGYVLYSYGPNLKDDNGYSDGDGPDDIGIRLPSGSKSP